MMGPKDSLRRQFTFNASANWVCFMTQLALAFCLSPFFVHRLGDQRYGIWALVESILAYFTLFDFGFAASIVRYVAHYRVSGCPDALNRIVNTCLAILFFSGIVGFAIVLALAFPLFGVLGFDGESGSEARTLLVVLGINLACWFPLNIFSCLLDGFGKYGIKASIRTVFYVLRYGLLVAALSGGKGLFELGLIILACSFLEQVSFLVAVKRIFPELRVSFALTDRSTFRLIRGYSFDAFLAMIAGRVSLQSGTIIIGRFLGAEFITFYVICLRLIELSKNLVRSVTTVLTAAISELDARGERDQIVRIHFLATRWVAYFILPIQCGFLILGQEFLAVWLGPRYAAASWPCLWILALPLGLAITQSVSARILYGMGRIRWFARLTLLEAALNVGLSVWLVRHFSIAGVAWAGVVPSLLFNLVLIVHVNRTLGVRNRDYFRSCFARPLVCAAIPCVVWLWGKGAIPVVNWPTFVFWGLVGTGLYGLVVVVLEIPGKVRRGFRWGFRRLIRAAPPLGVVGRK